MTAATRKPESALDRPRALTPEVQARIIQLMAEGNFFQTACKAAGTTPETVDYWRRLYESGAEHAQVFADFFSALKRASAVGEAAVLGRLLDGEADWQRLAWFLERRHSARWAKKTVVVVKGLPKDLGRLSDEELAAARLGPGALSNARSAP